MLMLGYRESTKREIQNIFDAMENLQRQIRRMPDSAERDVFETQHTQLKAQKARIDGERDRIKDVLQ